MRELGLVPAQHGNHPLHSSNSPLVLECAVVPCHILAAHTERAWHTVSCLISGTNSIWRVNVAQALLDIGLNVILVLPPPSHELPLVATSFSEKESVHAHLYMWLRRNWIVA